MKSEANAVNQISMGQKLFFRQTDGSLLEIEYNGSHTIGEALRKVYGEGVSEMNLIYKGKLLEVDKTVESSKIKGGSVIHVLKANSKEEDSQNRFVYISLRNILFKVALQQHDSVFDFQKKVQAQTSVECGQQRIWYKGNLIKTDSRLMGYEIQNEDILILEQSSRSNSSEEVMQADSINIFPIIGRGRRGSTGQKTLFEETSNKVEATHQTQLYKSDFNLEERNKKKVTDYLTIDIPASSSQFSDFEEEEMQKDIKQKFGNTVKSEEGDSPLLKINSKEQANGKGEFGSQAKNNIFSQQNGLNFKFEDDGEDLSFEAKTNQVLNLQAALGQLMIPGQEVVLCESYYEKDEKKQNGLGSSTEISKLGQGNDIKENETINNQSHFQEIVVAYKNENWKLSLEQEQGER